MKIERIPYTTREAWFAARQQDVTASVAGALLGVHEHTTAFSLWALKSGLLAEDPTESKPARRGRLLEDDALQVLVEDRPTWTVTAGGNEYLRAPALRIGATPDAYAVDPDRPGRGIVQVKTTSDFVFRKKWRDEAGDLVLPLWIACQAIVEAKLTGASWASVALLVVGHGLDLHVIDVPLHEGIWHRLVGEAKLFWERVASGEAPAADYARDGETIADLWPPDAAAEPLDLSADNLLPALLDEREAINARVKSDEKRLAEIKAEITAKLAGATAAQLADGRVITRTLQSRAEHTVKASTFPVLRVRAPRKAAA
ncbi:MULTISPECIES: YqaJ viral recombinase family protein [Methylorubrum]|uniref:YqaJ viral recombinase family nuclease n=1 Tax=Methylorubrum TaxID=2282523 RepID=UPI00209C7CFD|nr:MULTISPECIES: YqaJ viral recombinase family protein [Methylorubrum]MCP1550659.1 putative phage-related endonuclease [Methylorubrum zatmanii]MCP1552728.1 putative phage-related endonuclease [Methylorubrum extorquens]MCP1580962.1 putative phage-related endonuclease [Methylorubrum extorquens]